MKPAKKNSYVLLGIIIGILSGSLLYFSLQRFIPNKVSAVSGTLNVSSSNSPSSTINVTGGNLIDYSSALYYLDPSSTITTSLISTWHLEETSGSRADSWGINTLTDNNTVTSSTGKVGTAGQFTAANSEYLSITDNAALSMNSTDFTIAAWVYADSLGANRFFLTKDDLSGQREYGLYYLNSTGKFRFYVGNAAGSVSEVEDTSATVATGTWYLVVGWHDDTGNTINIQVNNATAVSTAYTSDVKDGTAAFILGRVGTTSYWNGSIDEVAVWKKVLTAAERTFLYNNGNGQAIGASLTTTGNVGIGTTTPLGLLHVTGEVGGNSLAIFNQTGNQDIFTASKSGSPKVTINNAGNIGIGTISPAKSLHIDANGATGTVELLGLGELANNYINFSVNSAGDLTIGGQENGTTCSHAVENGSRSGGRCFLDFVSNIKEGFQIYSTTTPYIEILEDGAGGNSWYIRSNGGNYQVYDNSGGVLRWAINSASTIDFYDTNDLQAQIQNDASAKNDDGWATAVVDYGEFMEKLDHNEPIYIYEVVGIKNGKITKNTSAATMYMVTSTDSGIRGGNPLCEDRNCSREGDPDWLAIAYIGQIPVLVDGLVNEGDYVIPSGKNDGRGKAVSRHDITPLQFRSVIGVALESSNNPVYEQKPHDPTSDDEIERELYKLIQRKSTSSVINVLVNTKSGKNRLISDIYEK